MTAPKKQTRVQMSHVRRLAGKSCIAATTMESMKAPNNWAVASNSPMHPISPLPRGPRKGGSTISHLAQLHRSNGTSESTAKMEMTSKRRRFRYRITRGWHGPVAQKSNSPGKNRGCWLTRQGLKKASCRRPQPVRLQSPRPLIRHLQERSGLVSQERPEPPFGSAESSQSGRRFPGVS